MKLITKELERTFSKYPIYSQEGMMLDAKVIVKYFNPAGAGTAPYKTGGAPRARAHRARPLPQKKKETTERQVIHEFSRTAWKKAQGTNGP